jgi:hypothetical protein
MRRPVWLFARRRRFVDLDDAAVGEVRAFLAASAIPERVDLVCFDTSTYREYLTVLGIV